MGAGDGPCAILMVGAHSGLDVRYPVSELAARYGASVEEETSDPGPALLMRQQSGSGESGRLTGVICPHGRN